MLKVLFFDQIFSRALRVRGRVFAPLRYAETGYTKYTVLARTELCVGVFDIKFCALYSNKYRS